MCGLGAILQSLGCEVRGGRAFAVFLLWYTGAPIAISLRSLYCDQYPDRDWRRNSDLAVLLFIALPIFRRRSHHFPPLSSASCC